MSKESKQEEQKGLLRRSSPSGLASFEDMER